MTLATAPASGGLGMRELSRPAGRIENRQNNRVRRGSKHLRVACPWASKMLQASKGLLNLIQHIKNILKMGPTTLNQTCSATVAPPGALNRKNVKISILTPKVNVTC